MKALLLIICALAWTASCYNEPPISLAKESTRADLPVALPSYTRGETLFRQRCVRCHGERGLGDGPQGSTRESRPLNFVAAMNLSPERAYQAISKGVSGTAMQAYPLLSDEDRWSLSFYVLSLGYQDATSTAGTQDAIETLKIALPRTRALATLSNQDILDDLRGKLIKTSTAKQVLTHLRTIAPYQDQGTQLQRFLGALARSIDLYQRDKREEARQVLQDSAMNDLSSVLEVVRIGNREIAQQVDNTLRSLRSHLEIRTPLRQVRQDTQKVAASVDLMFELQSRSVGTGRAVWQTAEVTLYCGIDGLLCLFLLLALGTRKGADLNERRAVGTGILTGLLLSVGAWLGWSHLNSLLPGELRTTLTLVVSISTLLFVLPLLVAAIRHFRRPPRTRLVAPPYWIALLFILSCATLVRDSLEIVPIMAEITNKSQIAMLGFVGMGIILIAIASFLVAVQRRLTIAPKAAVLCIFVTIIVVMSIGGATHAAQRLGYLPSSGAGFAHVPLLSLWPTQQGILLQFVGAAACTIVLLAGTIVRRESRRK